MKVIGIYQHFDCKEYDFQYLEKYEDLEIGEIVVVQDEEMKEEIATVKYLHDAPKNPEAMIAERTILRKLTLHDSQKMEANKERCQATMEICKKKIQEHNLQMYLLQTAYSLDGSKINFVFTSADRVDFRELVKDLAKTFQKQIHLQQIGPRDKAKVIGGYGKCGQQTCCSRFLPKLESVTMDMVRVQNLGNKGADKLSGLCGKLLCCLKYEMKQYAELKKQMPDYGDAVITVNGEKGKVTGVDIMNQKIRLLLEDASSKICEIKDIKLIKKGIKASENCEKELEMAV